MRKCFAVCLLCLLLTACSDVEESSVAEKIQAHYSQIQALTMTVHIAADFGDRVSEYTVTYQQQTLGSGGITVEKPVELQGITAIFQEGEGSLQYDGLILETNKLAGTALTPIDAVPTMMNTWARGYASEMGEAQYNEVDCYQLTYTTALSESVVEQVAWFAVDTYQPIHAETLVDGQLVIACDFEQVRW